MQKKKVELLAPAGSPEGFYGAIHAGADAVYLGGASFGARAYAENFSQEELISCIRYAHLWGRRVFLTVNTLVKEKEFSQIYPYLLPFYEAGLDGVIVQDMGVFQYIRRNFPDMELHVSTQMAITGVYGGRLLKDMGAKRIVPARELSLEEIRCLKQETGLEIETFIHGAMCYCYSGQCLFSSILGGRSGNRGRCAQPCRLPYAVSIDGKISEEAYPLSLKDMCTINHIPRFIEAGIDSFKIEGRMKKPEYAAGVTAIYRKYIDRYYEHPGTDLKIEKEDMEALSCLYIRSGKQDGYYFRHNGPDMVTMDNPSYSGSDEKLLNEIRNRYLIQKPTKKLQIYADFTLGSPAQVTMVWGELSATVSGPLVEAAQKQPVTEENICRQLQKLGDTVFETDNISITMSQNIFYPLKVINDLRRQASAELEKLLIQENGLCPSRSAMLQTARNKTGLEKKSADSINENSAIEVNHKIAGSLCISVKTKEQLQAVRKFAVSQPKGAISRLYIDLDLVYSQPEGSIQDILDEISPKCSIFLALPHILRKRDGDFLDHAWKCLALPGISGCLIRSLEGYGWLSEKGYQGSVAADPGIYIWNKETLDFWQVKLASFCTSLELNSREQKDINKETFPYEKLVYGRIPMMVTANCAARTMGQCTMAHGIREEQERNKTSRLEKTVFLKDRYQKHFPVVLNCTHCFNIIYNSVPLSLHGDMSKHSAAGLRMDFTIEDGMETQQLLAFFDNLAKGRKTSAWAFGDYTTGHEKRGVE